MRMDRADLSLFLYSPVCVAARPSFQIKDHAIVHAVAFYASMFLRKLAYAA